MPAGEARLEEPTVRNTEAPNERGALYDVMIELWCRMRVRLVRGAGDRPDRTLRSRLAEQARADAAGTRTVKSEVWRDADVLRYTYKAGRARGTATCQFEELASFRTWPNPHVSHSRCTTTGRGRGTRRCKIPPAVSIDVARCVPIAGHLPALACPTCRPARTARYWPCSPREVLSGVCSSLRRICA